MIQNNLNSNKRIAKNTLFMYFRMSFTMCVSIYTSRVILAALGFTDYGLYNVIGGVVAMFGFLNGAMTNAISRFLTFEIGKNDIKRLNDVFSMSVMIQFFLGVLIVLLGETVGLWFLHYKMSIPTERMFAANWVYQFSVMSIFLVVLNVPYNASVIAHEKMSAFAYLSIIDALLKLAIVYLLIVLPYDRLIIYAFLLFCVQLFNLIVYHWYSRRHFAETSAKLSWKRDLFAQMFSFAGWSTIGNMFFLLYTHGVNIILNIFFGPTVNAARGIAVQVEGVVKQFASNIQTAINPQIIKSYAQNDMDRMYTLIFASSRYCFFLLLLIELPILLQADFILHIWLGKYPEHTVNFIILTLANTMLDALINPMFTANLATGKIWIYHLGNSSVSMVFIPIIYFSLRYSYVPECAFLSIVAMNIVGILVRLFILKYQINICLSLYFRRVIVKVLGVVICISFIMYVLQPYFHNNFEGFIGTTLASIVSTIVVIYLCGINREERIWIHLKIRYAFSKVFKKE